VIKARREHHLAGEALQQRRVGRPSLVQHLDHRLPVEVHLIRPIHSAEATLIEALTQDKLAELSAAQRVVFRHPRRP
jgi:hypothetical protein